MSNELRIFLKGYLTPSCNIAPQIDRRPLVRITRFAPDMLDNDNLIASVDVVLDKLVQSGAIKGRSDADINMQISQHRVIQDEEIGTEIVITYPEMEEG